MVSVIMSTYCRNRPSGDCPNLLRRAVDSILSQTFKDFELILIDDGSVDGTESVCREYTEKDARVRHIRHERNCEGYTAKRYNEGMAFAKSDYFMFMFDDDMWFPNAIADLYGAITGEHRDCGMVYGLASFQDDGARILGSEWNLEMLKHGNFLGNLAVIVKREVINAVGGYDEDEVFRRMCDWDLWLRIGLAYPVARIPVVVGELSKQTDGIESTIPLDYRGMRNIQRRPNRELPLKGKL
jgi:glycosyltransferase involved in cell wall biosynthesis